MNKLENHLEGIEAFLWLASIVPVVNFVSGPTKSLIGTIQTISGVASGIFAVPFCWTVTGRKVFRCSVKHVVHGLGNVVSGLVLSTFLLGNCFSFIILVRNDGFPCWHYDSKQHGSVFSQVIYSIRHGNGVPS